MGPSYLRVAAGTCLLATGLVTGSSALALAAPDSGSENGGSQSQDSGANRKPGHATNGKGVSGSAGKSAASGRQAAVNTPNSATSTDGAGSTKGPSANAIATLPDAALPDAGGGAISSVPSAVSSAIRGIGRAVSPSAAASTAPTSLPVLPAPTGIPTTGPLAGALAPLSNLVGNVAGVLIGPQAAQPLVDAANQFLDQVATLKANANISTGTNLNKPVRTPAALPGQQLPDLQTVTLPAPVVPGSSLIGGEVAPTRVAVTPPVTTPGVMTPQLLSNRVTVTPAQPAPVAPTVTAAAPNWLSGVASQIFHGVREALRNVTLAELALAALPGAAGLLFFFATGISLGHRQAKFGFAMASSGAVRFAVRGPLGVVRNGSSVSVHSRRSASGARSDAKRLAGDGGQSRRHLRLVDRAA